MTATHKEFDIAVVGEINADLILKGNVVPAFGQAEQIIDDADLVMGSSAVIFACGAARLGLKTVFIGKTGDDLFGGFMIESMRERGIDVSGVTHDTEISTGFSVILAKPGDRAILTYPGSIPELRLSDIDLGLLSRCRHLHLSSFYLLDNLRPDVPGLFKNAKAMGMSVSLDTNYDPTENWGGGIQSALEAVDIFLPNETEARAISDENAVDSALQFFSKRIPTAVVKLGDQGAVAIQSGKEAIHQKASPVEVADTVGAGDSFDAGFIYGYLQGWTLEKCLQLGVACGSLSTLEPGGTEGQATIDNALDFIERYLAKQ